MMIREAKERVSSILAEYMSGEDSEERKCIAREQIRQVFYELFSLI